MGGRGGPKLKEYRVNVTSVRQWMRELEFDGVIVTEVYGNAFGNCQVILPAINSIMLSIDDSESKVKWLTINVGKLEEDQKHQFVEEEKKKLEIETVMRRRSMVGEMGSLAGLAASADSLGAASDSSELPEEFASQRVSDEKRPVGWEKIQIPKLEKYSGYDHPRPLWLFMRGGNVEFELNSANPPKMQKLVTATLNGIKLSEKELKDLDFQEEPADEKKRLRRKKKQEEEANKRKERKANEKRMKAEVQRPPEYAINVRINDLVKDFSDSNRNRHPMVILSTKDASADDFLFYGQSERVKGESSPVFYKTFFIAKTADESSDMEMELKFAVFDSEFDEFKKTHSTFLGDAYIKLKDIVSNEGRTEVKLSAKRLDKSALNPLASPKSKSEEAKSEPPASGTLVIEWHERVSEGSVVDYKFKLSAHHLPVHTSYLLALHIQDFNSIKLGFCGQTESTDKTVDPNWNVSLKAQHWSRDDRQLRFGVFDAKEFDPLYADKGLIAYYSTSFERILALKKANPGRPPLHLPLSSIEDGPISLHSDTALLMKIHELNEDGEPIPEDGDQELAHLKSEGPAEYFIASFAASKLNIPAVVQQANSSLVIGLFNQLTDKKFEFLGHTERLPFNGNNAFDFEKQFTLFKPLADGSIHSHAHSAAFNHSQPNSMQHKSGSSSRPHSSRVQSAAREREMQNIEEIKEEKLDEDGNPVPPPVQTHAPIPRPTNAFKIHLYAVDSSLSDSAFDAVHATPFREFQFSLTSAQLQRDFHELPIVEISKENKGEKINHGIINLRTADIGQIYQAEFGFAGKDLLKSESSIRSEPSPIIQVYSTNPLTKQPIFVGSTDRISGTRDPNFSLQLSLPRYSHLDREIKLLAYDAAIDGVPLTEKDLIGEASFSLHELSQRSESQPLELNLIRHNKTSHQIIYVINRSAAAIPMNAETALTRADSLARNMEYSPEERESGTSESADDNNYTGLYFGVHGLPKFDWGHDQFPQLALYKKSPLTGRFHLIDNSERVTHDVNPKFAKLFAIETPSKSQLYKAIIIDALPGLDNGSFQSFALLNEPSASNEEYEDARNVAMVSGTHLGEFIFDAASLLERQSHSLQLVDVTGSPIDRSSVHILTNQLSSAAAFAFQLGAVNLPKSAGRDRIDPVCYLFARSGQPGAAESELGRTHRVLNDPHPTWLPPLIALSFQNIDRELRFAIFDCDPATEASPLAKNFVAEVRVSMNFVIQTAAAAADHSVELKLTRDGEIIGENTVMKIKVTQRKTLSLDASDSGPASKRSQSRDKSRPNSSKMKSPKGAKSPPKNSRTLAAAKPLKSPASNRPPSGSAAASNLSSPTAKKSVKSTPPTSSRKIADSPSSKTAPPNARQTSVKKEAAKPEEVKRAEPVESELPPSQSTLETVESAIGHTGPEASSTITGTAASANPEPSVSTEAAVAESSPAESGNLPESNAGPAEIEESLPEPNEVN